MESMAAGGEKGMADLIHYKMTGSAKESQ